MLGIVDAVLKWIPENLIVLFAIGVTIALTRVLKYIVMIKHKEIMNNLDNLNLNFNKLSHSINSIRDEMKDSLLKVQYQMSNLVTREEHARDINDIRNRMSVIERIVKLENDR